MYTELEFLLFMFHRKFGPPDAHKGGRRPAMDASLSLAESASLEEEHARMRDNIEALYKTLGKSSGAATAVTGAPETPQAAAYSHSGVVSPLPAEPLPAASAPSTGKVQTWRLKRRPSQDRWRWPGLQ